MNSRSRLLLLTSINTAIEKDFDFAAWVNAGYKEKKIAEL